MYFLNYLYIYAGLRRYNAKILKKISNDSTPVKLENPCQRVKKIVLLAHIMMIASLWKKLT
jgi:hypothetical protein